MIRLLLLGFFFSTLRTRLKQIQFRFRYTAMFFFSTTILVSVFVRFPECRNAHRTHKQLILPEHFGIFEMKIDDFEMYSDYHEFKSSFLIAVLVVVFYKYIILDTQRTYVRIICAVYI